METKKTEATLEELNGQREEIKSEISILKRQLSRVTATIRSIEKFMRSIPEEKPKRKRAKRTHKSVAAPASA